MTDLSTTIAPKSDQLNSDDLISGPRDLVITKVRGCSEPDQPVAVHFEGDDGKPYKPCKSMRRVFVFAWGPDGKDYVGRSIRVYRDEKVMFGGIAVGGIRISHMSHIERDLTMALTATRAKRSPFTVRVLQVQRAAPKIAPSDNAFDAVAWGEKLERELPDYASVEVIRMDWNEHKDELKAQDIDAFKRVNLAIAKRAEEIGKSTAGAESDDQ